MIDMNMDALKEAAYANTSPEFYKGEDEPETALDDDLEALGNIVHNAWMLAYRIKDTHRIRRINGVIDKLCEAEELIENMQGEKH